MKGTLRIGMVAFAVLGALLVASPTRVHAGVACNEGELREPGCNWKDLGPGDCNLRTLVTCDSSCTTVSTCVYDFGQDYFVNVYDDEGTSGKFEAKNGKSITIKSYLIKTDASTGKTRFETDNDPQAGPGNINLDTTPYTTAPGGDPDINISGKIVAPDGRAEVEGRWVVVHQVDVEPVDTASGSLPGDLASADVGTCQRK